MGLLVLFVLQLAVALAGFAILWRKLDRTRSELDSLQTRLRELEAERLQHRRPKRVAPAATVSETVVTETPHARAARAWGGTGRRQAGAPPISDELKIGTVLGLSVVLPAFAYVFGVGGAAPVCVGVLAAAVLMAVALREKWRPAAWAAVISGALWSGVGFLTGVALTDTEFFAAALAIAGVAGCGYAVAQRLHPGAVLASLMAASALLLAARSDVIGPAGAAFASIVAAGAIAGAANLRLEALHVGAFLASLLGLFVLSGQPSAAVWFNPAASLSGALFFAIAAIRTPQLGARGVTIAGAGVLGPFTAVITLSAAEHGLAGGVATGAGFMLIGLAFAGLLFLVARQRADRLASLGATLWILALAATTAFGAAILYAAPQSIAPPALACLAVSAAMIGERFHHPVWRVIAIGLSLASTACGAITAQSVLAESSDWPGALATSIGLALPAILFGSAVWRLQANGANAPVGLFKFLAGALAIATADLAVRLAFSGGAVKLHPISFVEAGAHVSVWLAAALFVAAMDKSRKAAYVGAAAALGAGAIAALSLMGFLWLTPFWVQRDETHDAALPLGFLFPALLFGAHWALLRTRGSRVRARVAFAACALSLAATAALAISAYRAPIWVVTLIVTVVFAMALAVNFAPGVVSRAGSPRHPIRDRA